MLDKLGFKRDHLPMNTRKFIIYSLCGFVFSLTLYLFPAITSAFEFIGLRNLSSVLANETVMRIATLFFFLLTAYGLQMHVRAGNWPLFKR